jgi:penicillin-binding protein 1A
LSERSKLQAVYRFFMQLDSYVSSTLFEVGDGIKRGWAAYVSFLERFRIWGVKRVIVDLLDDAATFGLIFALGLITFALPPFSGTGDIWNQNRQLAVTFTDVNGEIIGHRGVRQDDAIPLDEIPRHVIEAVLATEDSRFYNHFGVDIQGTTRAMLANAKASGVVQGGSTLTQQLAKNLFLSPERTLRRKVHEAFLALWIEARLSKDEILKMYLDRSYLGGGNYGVEAAAQYYFGKSIRDVNLQEAAMLAGLFKAPSTYAPHVNIERSRARANIVLHRMLDVGFVSQGDVLEAKRQPATAINQSDFYSPDYFLDWAYKETADLIKEQRLDQDYVIEVKTTIDLAMQKSAQRIVNEMLDTDAIPYRASEAALVSMEPNGAIKAIVGGRDYENSQFNRATDALRQPGSAFKAFVYLAALENGYDPNSVVYDAPVSVGSWSPRNYTHRYAGRTSLTNALARSFNTVPVHLMKRIGRTPIIEAAHAAGIQSNLLAVPSLPLGTNEVTVLDLTTGYATFANGGVLARPHAVLEMRRPNGDVIYDRSKNGDKSERTISEEKVAQLNFMLNKVVTSGTGRRAKLGFTPQAGKTGTTQNYRDAWFVGYTAHYVTGIWYGNDDFTPTNRATGGSLPAMTWQKFMSEALKTKVAAGLVGVPLDDTYSQYAAAQSEQIEIPLKPAEPQTQLRTVRSTETERNATNDIVVSRTPRRSDAVVQVLQDMFSVFSNKPNATKRNSGTVEVFKPSQNRSARGQSNSKRLRRLMDSR